jgi:hypothetical protein
VTQNIQSLSWYNRIQLYVNIGLMKCGIHVMASWRLKKMLQHKMLHIWTEITYLTGKFQVIRITSYLFCICCLTSVLSAVKFRYLSRARNLRVLNQGNEQAMLLVYVILSIVLETLKNSHTARWICGWVILHMNHKWILICRSTFCSNKYRVDWRWCVQHLEFASSRSLLFRSHYEYPSCNNERTYQHLRKI